MSEASCSVPGHALNLQRRVIMPGKNGTGPMSGGYGAGAGAGAGTGGGRGRNQGPFAAGPGGSCICPKCKTKAAHIQGQPCNQTKCPKCGAIMTRG